MFFLLGNRRKSAVTKAIDMHRVILAAKSKQGLPKGRAQVWLGGEGLLLWVQGEVQLGRWGALVFFLLFFFYLGSTMTAP